MSFRDPTDEARANWDDHTDDYQANQVIMWAAGHIRRHKEKYFPLLGKDVVAIGFGNREERVRRKGKKPYVRILDELAIKVYVAKKWTQATFLKAKFEAPEEIVPEWIQVRVPVPAPLPKRPSPRLLRSLWDPSVKARKVKGWPRWREMALPTDVCPPRDAIAEGQPLRVVATKSDGSGRIRGTSCTVVKVRGTQGTQPYVLGCIHVMMRSLRTEDAVPEAGTRNLMPDNGSEARVGDVIGAKIFNNTSPISLDAALVKLSTQGRAIALKDAYWRAQPSGQLVAPSSTFRSLRALETFLRFTTLPVRLYPARGGTISMSYTGVLSPATLFYKGTGVAQATMHEVLTFEADPRTTGGDSGSPVVAGNWFIGMHVGRPKGTSTSWVLPCYQVLGSHAFKAIPGQAAFDKGLDLATDLIE